MPRDPCSPADALLRDRLEAAATALQPPTSPTEVKRRQGSPKAIHDVLGALRAGDDDGGADRAARERLSRAADFLYGGTGEGSVVSPPQTHLVNRSLSPAVGPAAQ